MCPILRFFQIPCPTCGVTRALFALLRLDIESYLQFHPLALFLVGSVWLLFHKDLFKRKWIIYLFITVTLVLNTILYVIKMYRFFN